MTVPRFEVLENSEAKSETVETLLAKKHLAPDTFKSGTIKVSDAIAKHAEWAFTHIYSVPYPDQACSEGIARVYHGIQHTARVAMYIPILANLYRRYGDEDALAMTNEDLHLLQIAALFHDSAREGEAEDLWDNESGVLLYSYLNKVLGIGDKAASEIAIATANKDSCKDKKTLFQKLIHDADCLDIIRARNSFDANYLDFYQSIARENKAAFDDMAQLITEVRSIIVSQGDSRYQQVLNIKKQYEQPQAYPAVLQSLSAEHLCLMPKLYGEGLLLSGDKLKQNLLNKHDELLRQGKVFARSIPSPSAIRAGIESKQEETLAQTEIRKTLRRPGVATRTLKPNRLEKNGNPNRSVSMLGWGGTVYSCAGFLIYHPDINDIAAFSGIDFNTGRHKKKKLELKSEFPVVEKQAELAKLMNTQKMGGSSRKFGKYFAAHSEIILRIKNYDAVYFTLDPTLCNVSEHNEYLPVHASAPVLQAIYLQKEYANVTGVLLPLYEYSGIHNYLKTRVQPYSKQEIFSLWLSMCIDYMKNQLQKAELALIAEMSIEDIKVFSMYLTKQNDFAKYNGPGDSNYDLLWRQELDQLIVRERSRLLEIEERRITQAILDSRESFFSCPLFYDALKYSKILDNLAIKTKLTLDIEAELKSALIFNSDTIIIREHEILQCINGSAEAVSPLDRIHSAAKIVKVFKLACKLKLTSSIDIIRQWAEKEVRQIQLLIEYSSVYFFSTQFRKMLWFIVFFDLKSISHDTVCESITKLITTNVKASPGFEDLDLVALVALELKKYHFHNEALNAHISSHIRERGKAIATGGCHCVAVNNYIRAANAVQIPLSEQCVVVKNYLLNRTTKFTDQDDILMARLALNGLFNDLEIFTIALSTVRKDFSSYESLYSAYTHVFLSSCKIFEANLTALQGTQSQRHKILEDFKQTVAVELTAEAEVRLRRFDIMLVNDYLQLAMIAKIPLVDQAKVLAVWIKKSFSDHRPLMHMAELREFLNAVSLQPDLLVELDLFAAVVNNISACEGLFFFDTEEFYEQVKLLKEMMPDKKFNPDQLVILERQIDKMQKYQITNEKLLKIESGYNAHKNRYWGLPWLKTSKHSEILLLQLKAMTCSNLRGLFAGDYIKKFPQREFSKRLSAAMQQSEKNEALETLIKFERKM